jgi:hypothetical protein
MINIERVCIRNSTAYSYFIYADVFGMGRDIVVAGYAELSIKNYRQLMIDKFNAYIATNHYVEIGASYNSNELFFTTREDAQNAATWLEDFINSKKLMSHIVENEERREHL